MILMSKEMAFMSAIYAYNCAHFDTGVSAIRLMVGSPPSDAQVDTITQANHSALALITGALSVTMPVASNAMFLPVNASAVLPQKMAYQGPIIKGTAVKAGTLTWAVIMSGGYPMVVDVGLPNSGAMLQVDKTLVIVGTVVSVLAYSFQAWRQ